MSLQYIEPVVVVEKDSIAWKGGLRPWDRIVAVNEQPVERWSVAKRLLNASSSMVTLTFIREEPIPGVTEQTGGVTLKTPKPAQEE